MLASARTAQGEPNISLWLPGGVYPKEHSKRMQEGIAPPTPSALAVDHVQVHSNSTSPALEGPLRAQLAGVHAAGGIPPTPSAFAVDHVQVHSNSTAPALEGPLRAQLAGAHAASGMESAIGASAIDAVSMNSADKVVASFPTPTPAKQSQPSWRVWADGHFFYSEQDDRNVIIGVLYFLFILLMFWAKHTTCDAYVMPAINVFMDKMRASERPWLQRWGEEAVAGATICAFGCNGPELFTNFVSLYTGSDAGIGTVVGSELFNLLIISGATVMATRSLPLQLDVAPFTRDVFFYGVSMALLYWILSDKKVEFWESLVLLTASVLYVGAVYFTTDVAEMVWGAKAAPNRQLSDQPDRQPSDQSARQLLDEAARQPSKPRRRKSSSFHGVEVQVEKIIHNRMTDAKHSNVKMDSTDFGKEAGIDVASTKPSRKHSRRPSLGPQLDDAQDGVPEAPTLLYNDLKEVVVLSEGVMELEFCPSVLEHVTLRLKCATSVERDALLAMIREHSLGRPWEHEYDSSVFFAFSRFKHALTGEDSIVEKLLAFPELFINVFLMGTLSMVDVKDIRKEELWPLCFLGGMVWLALQSYLVLEAVDCIHYHIDAIPTAYMGITILAVGTSFPNAVASVILAQQGKPDAAIANMLGSNVQNVFLAMAMPWAFYSAQSLSFGAIDIDVAGINQGIVWMMGTLALFLLLALWTPTFTLLKSHGILLVLIYVAYLVDATVDQFFIDDCPSLMSGFLC
jgi:Ca2+/Na+ antiporter